MEKFWSEGMGEISGFGGSYELGCRTMVLAGIEWLDNHPNADPKFRGNKNVFGLLIEDNEDAKELTNAIMDAVICHPDINNGEPTRCRKEATGAMHHAVINHLFAYMKLGWEKYKEELTEKSK